MLAWERRAFKEVPARALDRSQHKKCRIHISFPAGDVSHGPSSLDTAS